MRNQIEHNRHIITTLLDMREYWDFRVALSKLPDYNRFLFGNCLGAYIDTNIPNCIAEDGVVSLKQYKWEESVNKGITLSNIGFTGIDNGLITYERDYITNEEFLKLFTESTFKIDEGDTTLKLHTVSGNNGLYSYYNQMVDMDDMNVAELKGGFFQGFFRTGDGCDYKVLPSDLSNGACFEFALKPVDFDDVEENSFYNLHPNNRGTFFYMGTRAENKWWKYYEVDTEFPKTDIEQPEYTYPENEDIDFTTDNGLEVKQANIKRIESDNGFLIFDRTKEGITASEWEEGTTVTIDMPSVKPSENYFQIVHRGKDGYTASTIGELEEKESRKYDVLADLYYNALSFIVTETGKVGYRYFVRNCDVEEGYSVVSEYSHEGLVKKDEWSVITVRVSPEYVKKKDLCPEPVNEKPCNIRLLFYVNAKLVLVSKPLICPEFRVLNDNIEKQEGVAFNISVGGGTQGLCDVIYADYLKYPEYILPLEQNFGGSFSGYLKSFKFFTCDKDYELIRKSVEYEFKSMGIDFCLTGDGDAYPKIEADDDNYLW